MPALAGPFVLSALGVSPGVLGIGALFGPVFAFVRSYLRSRRPTAGGGPVAGAAANP